MRFALILAAIIILGLVDLLAASAPCEEATRDDQECRDCCYSKGYSMSSSGFKPTPGRGLACECRGRRSMDERWSIWPGK